MKITLSLLLSIIFIGCSEKNTETKHIYTEIKINEKLIELITVDTDNNICSGVIRSQKGLNQYIDDFNLQGKLKVTIDFDVDMLIFSITNNTPTRAYKLLKNNKTKRYVLSYYDTGIHAKLPPLEKGKNYAILQVFQLKKIDKISRIKLKNLVLGKKSKTYK